MPSSNKQLFTTFSAFVLPRLMSLDDHVVRIIKKMLCLKFSFFPPCVKAESFSLNVLNKPYRKYIIVLIYFTNVISKV